ncbi:MAG TPA: membrane protein insertase YidC [Bacteroidales bacterium]|nr:membrane protein insertase YidC [Bacteroidales bacterium]
MSNRNTVIGLILIFGIFIAYSYLMSPSKKEQAEMKRRNDSAWIANQQKRANAITAQARQQAIEHAHRKEAIGSGQHLDSAGIAHAEWKDRVGVFAGSATGTERHITVENDVLRIRISTLGGKVDYVELKKYKTWDQKPLVLLDRDSLHFGLSFFSNNRIINTNSLYFKPFVVGTGRLKDSVFTASGKDSVQVAMRLYADASDTSLAPDRYIEFVYTLRGGQYMTGFTVNFSGMDQVIDDNTKFLVLNWSANLKELEKSLKMERMNSTIYYKYYEDKVDYIRETKNEEKYLRNERIQWVSFKQQFFSSTLIAGSYFTDPKVRTETLPMGGNYLRSMYAELGLPFSPKEVHTIPMSMYYGPNKFYTLKSYHVGLERQIPLGWSFFLMAWINIYAVIPVFSFFGNLGWNYGIIILILTILLKIILYPISYKTYKSSAKMRALRPDLDELNKRYPKKEDAMKKQQATMDLYKRAGVNPMAGCIPLLLQMPILIAMFRFFPSSIELRQQSFLWAKDLSSYDAIWTFPGNFSIPFYGNHISLFALLMTISSVIYTRVNDQMMGSTQQQMPGMKMMMYLMPVMFLFWFNDYSSGLSYYYLMANLLTFAQIWLIRRTIDEKKLHAQIEANKKKPVKKSGFQKRLEDMAKQRGYSAKR